MLSLFFRMAPQAGRWVFYDCSVPGCQSHFPGRFSSLPCAFRCSQCLRWSHSKDRDGSYRKENRVSWIVKPRGRLSSVQGLLATLLHLSLRLASLIIKHRSFINIWTPWRQPAIISNSVPTATPPQLQRKLITRSQILQITFPSSQMMFISSS